MAPKWSHPLKVIAQSRVQAVSASLMFRVDADSTYHPGTINKSPRRKPGSRSSIHHRSLDSDIRRNDGTPTSPYGLI